MGDFQAVAVIPAAGSGRRMNGSSNKVWLTVDGRNLPEHTLEVFQSSSLIDFIVLLVNPAEQERFKAFLAKRRSQFAKAIVLVPGGAERQDSVGNGLKYLAGWPGWRSKARRLVVIHDAARILLTRQLLEQAVHAGEACDALGVGVPVKDTIKQVDRDGYVTATPTRSSLWAIQTPQVFDFDQLSECYRRIAGSDLRFTDDCGIVEYCGYRVRLIPGSYENIKITTPEDLTLAEAILGRRSRADRARL